MTLIELVVTMALVTVLLGIIFPIYRVFASSAAASRTLSTSQERVHYVLRILEADVRSADPLLLVPSSFTLDPSPPAVTSSGATGTTPTDVIAMFETTDLFSPCATKVASTTVTVPSPFVPSPVAANLIWAYNPTAGTLTRYSYCSADSPAAWKPGVVLTGLVNDSGTMFTVHQDVAASAGTQATTPTSTSLPNQATPVCGTSLAVYLQSKSSAQTIAYTVQLAVALPNQNGVEVQAC